MVTDRPGMLLGILTADCAPVLLADPEAGVVGAAHAGWRGALGRGNRRDDRRDGSSSAPGASGSRPRSGRASRSVLRSGSRRSATASSKKTPATSAFSSDGPRDKPHFDLEAYVVARLVAAGIGRVEGSALDTYADPDRFYSYRRATHRGERDYGRQISMIGIAGRNRQGKLTLSVPAADLIGLTGRLALRRGVDRRMILAHRMTNSARLRSGARPRRPRPASAITS